MRYLPYREENGYLSMGLDEALLLLRIEDKVEDTFRFYSFFPSCASIGYFQRLSSSINLDYCFKNNIDYVRRITGGGNVFHDYMGEITYSIVLSEKKSPDNILDSFEFIYGGIIKGLKNMDINVEFKPLNDLTFNSKKISGSAQTRKNGIILQHGTLMFNTNIELMEKVLRISNQKTEIRKRVTTLSREGYNIGKKELIKNLKKGFEEIYGKSNKGKLSRGELSLAKKLAYGKYKSKEWNYKK
ncbi:MAG: Lipoate-protein ligase A subunit 1 [Candidatus Methanofastidiosum methylothiophilum]|uniref:Lipoate-protein ligase A subunit 1 n=1 Tax=Candidatus Methanofastidiosum methylothiophilum TaxID=1705564 RepID=A0A150JGX7_9EURY|nr:MAG: Lipoate-protein ligase A subunit 1 [Candidatus Methanofastidiosum methylthiophilus]MBP6932324.1 lipoate--protein ligase family protein [Methanofastidiosum sp.]OQC52674.1 MAG: Lipoate-protein ligase A subunit 1 [Euryarchaeota archaeon ADurb.Bin023]KYC56465.1 MAG: Lipoate-protein ligase A subunit 1 [Candidatus Methanofastidiosum methylthiophilus]KYC58312.1 MAG: Lipoate-protein ligase A subunit 1 [Candidatus Methanofastidiosum methylthiophilus]